MNLKTVHNFWSIVQSSDSTTSYPIKTKDKDDVFHRGSIDERLCAVQTACLPPETTRIGDTIAASGGRTAEDHGRRKSRYDNVDVGGALLSHRAGGT